MWQYSCKYPLSILIGLVTLKLQACSTIHKQPFEVTTNRALCLIDIAETPIMLMSPQPKEKETNLTHYFVKLMNTSVPFVPRKGNTLPSVSHAVNRFN